MKILLKHLLVLVNVNFKITCALLKPNVVSDII